MKRISENDFMTSAKRLSSWRQKSCPCELGSLSWKRRLRHPIPRLQLLEERSINREIQLGRVEVELLQQA